MSLRRRERGCPMPPPAPRTATLVWRAADEENWRDWVSARREERANMVVVVVNGEEVEGGDERGERQTRETLRGLISVRSSSDWLPHNTGTYLLVVDGGDREGVSDDDNISSLKLGVRR